MTFFHFLSHLPGPLSFYTALENNTSFLQQFFFGFGGGSFPLPPPCGRPCIIFNHGRMPCLIGFRTDTTCCFFVYDLDQCVAIKQKKIDEPTGKIEIKVNTTLVLHTRTPKSPATPFQCYNLEDNFQIFPTYKGLTQNRNSFPLIL